MQPVFTPSEVEAALSRQESPVLVQFERDNCPRCAPLALAVEALKTEFVFEHLVATVPYAPELVQHFEVSELPAFVVLSKVDSHGELVQAARLEHVHMAVRSMCSPRLRLDEDF
jgi:thiol-disulfide isomerase/thioredoxin